MKILLNSIKCKKCSEILISEHTHDFRTCSCGSVSIDGGKDYLHRVGDDYEELSKEE